MKLLVDKVPSRDNVLFVFFVFETSVSATEHVPNLVCLQQFCSQCENESDINVDFERCGQTKHSFFDDLVGDLLTYLCKPRAWYKLLEEVHNASSFDTHFIRYRAILLKWSELIMNGLKVVCMRVHNLTFFNGASYLAMPLRKLPGAFGLAVLKSWYPYILTRRRNSNMLGRCP
jgi:hypothetical protein